MKIMAAIVVALFKNVDAPAPPNKVWLDPPPKAAPMSAPLPVWSSTIKIKAKQTTTCKIIRKIDIIDHIDNDFNSNPRFALGAPVAGLIRIEITFIFRDLFKP